MDNLFHLVVEMPQGTLTAGMNGFSAPTPAATTEDTSFSATSVRGRYKTLMVDGSGERSAIICI